MLVEKIVKIKDSDFVYHYSDNFKYIRLVDPGILYVTALDPIEYKDVRIYEETNIELSECDKEIFNEKLTSFS